MRYALKQITKGVKIQFKKLIKNFITFSKMKVALNYNTVSDLGEQVHISALICYIPHPLSKHP